MSRWGLAPVALALALVVAIRIGAIAFQSGPPRERLLLGGIATTAAIAVGVRVLGAVGALNQETLFGALFVAAASLVLWRRDRKLGLDVRAMVSIETAPVAVVAIGVLGLVAVAAYVLPIWQWDSLGYHLPYVNFALQRGSLADVPPDVPYVSTYPHAVEHLFVAWRAMLPDDRLVDLAQLPLGLLGAGAVAVLARRLGARADHALAAGLLWLTLPATFLQLPTNYVDVASSAFLLTAAAFVVGPLVPARVMGVGLALGLFLASKPNAPIGTAIVLSVLFVRGWKEGRRESLALAVLCVLAIGSESYLVNLARHGNPIWPVQAKLGPWSLPGPVPMTEVLESGPAAPRLHGPLPIRLVQSWLSLDAPPVFDMRFGGLGLVYLAALPAAVFLAVKKRWVALGVMGLAALASPDPAVPRYVLAFPGLVLAAASCALERIGDVRVRRGFVAALALAAALGVVRSYRGLTGDGPELDAYRAMTEEQRALAVSANGSPAEFHDAVARIGPGETTAFDASLDLPYLAWPSDLSRRAVRIPDGIDAEGARRFVADPHVRLLVVDPTSPVAAAARAEPGLFTELFQCKSQCVVLLRI